MRNTPPNHSTLINNGACPSAPTPAPHGSSACNAHLCARRPSRQLHEGGRAVATATPDGQQRRPVSGKAPEGPPAAAHDAARRADGRGCDLLRALHAVAGRSRRCGNAVRGRRRDAARRDPRRPARALRGEPDDSGATGFPRTLPRPARRDRHDRPLRRSRRRRHRLRGAGRHDVRHVARRAAHRRAGADQLRGARVSGAPRHAALAGRAAGPRRGRLFLEPNGP